MRQVHYRRTWQYGSPHALKRPRSYERTNFVVGDTAFVQLAKGAYVLADARDYPSVSLLLWQPTSNGQYAQGFVKGHGQIKLHRFLLNPPEGLDVDHINHEGLDCRRRNMRVVTRMENNQNSRRNVAYRSSEYKGVSFHPLTGKWQAMISLNRKSHYLGLFPTPEEAARAYSAKAKELGFIYIPPTPNA